MKKLIKLFTLLIVVLSLFSLIGCGNNENSVLLYSDFNDGNGNFSQDAYYTEEGYSEFSHLSEGGVDNTGCLKITNFLGNDSRFVTELKLTKNKIYKISAYIKTESLSFDNFGGASLSIYSLNAAGFSFISEDQDFKEFVQYVSVDKTDSYNLCLRLGYFSGDTTGTVYFDNIKVQQVASAPQNVTVATVNQKATTQTVTDAEYNENTYKDMRIASIIIALVFLAVFILWYKSINNSQNTKEISKKSFVKSIILIFVIALVLRIVLAATYYQCSIDVNLFKYWGNVAAKDFLNFYQNASNCDYPPLYIYFLALFSKLSFGNSGVFTVLVKLTGILCDFGIAGFILLFCKKNNTKQNLIYFLISVWLFNPIVLVDSSCWGQVDTVLSLFIIAVAYFITEKKYLFAGLFFGLGVMLKPQMIIFLPVCGSAFLYHFILGIKNKEFRKALMYLPKVVGGIVAGLLLPALPFLNSGLVELFKGTVDHYCYATVNAYNFWFILGKNWVKDSEHLLGISYYTWGMIAIVISSLIVLLLFALNYIKNKEKPDFDKSLVYIGGAFIYMFVFSFGPRMHERYFFPCVALLLISYIYTNRKELMYILLGASTFGFIIIHEIMMGLECGTSINNAGGSYESYSDMYWPSATSYRIIISVGLLLCAIAVFVYICYYTFKRDKK